MWHPNQQIGYEGLRKPQEERAAQEPHFFLLENNRFQNAEILS